MLQKNLEIRETAKNTGVRLWQIAERYGISDSSFSRKLRQEFPPEDKLNILEIIAEFTKEN